MFLLKDKLCRVPSARMFLLFQHHGLRSMATLLKLFELKVLKSLPFDEAINPAMN
ncbi:hypothetical protein PQO03_02460 [Lentisphaera profundi]|uniref:Uncharacterized protein n=1 Tax=Lentisphaera profundi TaxID=1658616 RepID=A0ABY7VXN0_9BACT|nr:hypothetical protein [Lentisphaera profundi]WDE96823.1 hypothetical protein PQO03_02460 [Lentisphaera profundi]